MQSTRWLTLVSFLILNPVDSSTTPSVDVKKDTLTGTKSGTRTETFRGYLAFLLLCEPDSYCIPMETKANLIQCLESGSSMAALHLYRQCTGHGSVTCDDQPITRTIKTCLKLQTGSGNLITDASRQCIRDKVTLGHLDCYRINSKLRRHGHSLWSHRKYHHQGPHFPNMMSLFTTPTSGPNFGQSNNNNPFVNANYGQQPVSSQFGQHPLAIPNPQIASPVANQYPVNPNFAPLGNPGVGQVRPNLSVFPLFHPLPPYEVQPIGYPPRDVNQGPDRDVNRQKELDYSDESDDGDRSGDTGDRRSRGTLAPRNRNRIRSPPTRRTRVAHSTSTEVTTVRSRVIYGSRRTRSSTVATEPSTDGFDGQLEDFEYGDGSD
ncbi:hypothetical protein HDE_10746 [Halotydeus destructor]|nr:hypothetical protein HDE_10746 [Halotydeus destructor]